MPLRWCIGLLAALLVVTSGGTRGIAYLCGMTGKLQASTCCCSHGSQAAEESHGEVRWSRPSCCEAQTMERDASPAAEPEFRSASELLRAAPGLMLARYDGAVSTPLVRSEWRPMAARGPPRLVRPPLYVHHCRFLL